MQLSRAIILYGTEQPVEPSVTVSAGPLTAELDGGNLRYVRIDGVEALRGIAYLARDRNWGTYTPEIADLAVEQTSDGFSVRYTATCRDDSQSLRYRVRIEGKPDGSLRFEADGEALTDFVTNRTGFVVLHPLAGVVGRPVTVEHTDGRVERATFPERIDPACPFQDIAALGHEIAPGVTLTCRMRGEAFEMEDHRNWMDASYKTYVRPLALPWPYTIPAGERFSQSVEISLDGRRATAAAGVAAAPVRVAVGEPLGHAMPALGLAAAPEHTAAALAGSAPLGRAGPGFIVCHFDPRQGHDRSSMLGFGKLGEAVGAELVLEAVVPCLDAAGRPSADGDILERDMAAIAEAARGVGFARVAVSPATDLKCTLPGSAFPPAPGWEALAAAARRHFPGVPVGGGMFSYFTEFNRKRPPRGLFDFVCHTGSPIVHAGDDVSVTETLEALPSIFASARAIAGDAAYWIFPTAIGMRDNPYGAAPAENPHNVRQAMNRVDPRERALLGAAWYAGYLAHAARAGVEAVTLGACAGPAGIVYSRQDHAQPWFDGAEATVMPTYPVIAGHAALGGAQVLATEIADGRSIQALAARTGTGVTLWLANLTGKAQKVRLEGIGGNAALAVLDAESFAAVCQGDGKLADRPMEGGTVALDAYAVARVTAD